MNASSADKSTLSTKDTADTSSSASASSQTRARYLTPDELAIRVDALKQQRDLAISDIKDLLAACMDTEKLSAATCKQIGADTAQKVAWGLVTRQFNLHEDQEALTSIVRALDDPELIRCVAAAQLLQYCVRPPIENCRGIAEKISQKLKAQELSFRLLEVPGTQVNTPVDFILLKRYYTY